MKLQQYSLSLHFFLLFTINAKFVLSENETRKCFRYFRNQIKRGKPFSFPRQYYKFSSLSYFLCIVWHNFMEHQRGVADSERFISWIHFLLILPIHKKKNSNFAFRFRLRLYSKLPRGLHLFFLIRNNREKLHYLHPTWIQ